jgi:hypothetical protein
MAKKSDFTDQEWEQLQHGISGTTLLVSLADPGLFDTLKEAGAAARYLTDARRGDDSELVREVAASPAMSFGFGKSRQELETETIAALRSAISTLNTKAPDEVAAYRQFVLRVAQSVAEAAGGVAGEETGAIERIRSALESAVPER